MLFNIFFLAFTLFISSYTALVPETFSTYMVFMDSEKMKALEVSLGLARTWQEEIIEYISISNQVDHDLAGQNSSPVAQLHYAYDTILSAAFSARLTEQHLENLKGVDGFVLAVKDELLTLHTTHSPQFLGLHDGQGLWSAQNLASDVIIGLVDTGICPEHPSFDDSGLSGVPFRWKGKTCETGTNLRAASNCNKKLIGAAAFFKAYESEHGRINETSDYRSALDSSGHGTHTASTAGGNRVEGANILGRANGTAAGMRPTARIAAYKACFKSGCFGSDILAAMEQAVKDGVDILSLSLGGDAVPYHDDPIAIAAFGAIKKGVTVSMSAGNYGPGSFTVVNSAPWLMTVAASSTDRSFPARVRLGDGRFFSGTSLNSENATMSLLLVYNETNMNATLCEPGSLLASLVKGKIVICVRGGVTDRVAKGEAVKAAGGAGMILANRVGDGEVTIPEAHVLPAISLGFSEGNAVINYAKSSSHPTAKIEFQEDVLGNRAPVMAWFSSRGPNPLDLNIVKPDVTAPGVDILAAWPSNVSRLFNLMSGTSMSCPHVSGLIALLKSLHPDWSPAAIKSALMTTAYVYDSEKKIISDWAATNGSEPANPFVFGSGHVDPERASDPGLVYDISERDYLNYLCGGLNYNSTQMAPFVGKENQTTYCSTISRFRPGDLNCPSFSVVFSTNLTGTTHRRTVTNVGIGVSTYNVRVGEPKGVSITVRPKKIQFRKIGDKLSYNVTFKGRKGVVQNKTDQFSFGYLEWVSTDNKYSVRSPVAVTWIK